MNTTLENNWSVDILTTNVKAETSDNRKEPLVIVSLNGVASKRTQQLKALKDKTSVYQSQLEKDISFKVPRLSKSVFSGERLKYFSRTQKWIGHIQSFNGQSIIAKLTDLNNPTTYEIAEFDIKEIPFEDRPLISVGAGFYWSLGYVNDNGQIEKKSLIRFQRSKPWEEADLNNMVDEAERLYQKLNEWS